MIVDRINDFLTRGDTQIDEALLAEIGKLASWSFLRQFGPDREEKSPATLRLSSIGRCPRQQAYRLLGFEENGKSIDARAKTVFFMGDLTELAVVGLAKAAGCVIQTTGLEQKTVELDGISGHPDGVLIEGGEIYLLEVKSMSSYGFGELQRGIIDEGYRWQINAYLEALNLDKCILVALNKDAGVLHEVTVAKNPEIVKQIKDRIVLLRLATKETLPERPYKPNEKGILPWQCAYCFAYRHCWPEAEKVLVSKSYKLKIPKKEKTIETPSATQN